MAKSQASPGQGPVAGSDNKQGPANSNDSLTQTSKPRVLNDMTTQPQGATPSDLINPMQRPGFKASSTAKGKF